MNTVFFIAYLGFMVLWFFVHIPRIYQHNANFVIQRNPGWLRDHPGVLARIRNRTWATWSSFALGAGLITLLVMAATGKTPVERMSALFMPTVLVIVLISVLETSRVSRYFKRIPPPDNREVDLLRKGLGDFVPLPWVCAPLLALIGLLAVYVHAYSTQAIPTDIAYRRMVGITGVLVLLALAYLSLFHRPGYRRVPREIQKIESYVLVFSLFFCVFIGLWRFANDFFGALMFSRIYLDLGFSIVLQFAPFIYRFDQDQGQIADPKADDTLGT